MNRDPIGERGGYGLYAFVFNFPAGLVDHLGKESVLPPEYQAIIDSDLFGLFTFSAVAEDRLEQRHKYPNDYYRKELQGKTVVEGNRVAYILKGNVRRCQVHLVVYLELRPAKLDDGDFEPILPRDLLDVEASVEGVWNGFKLCSSPLKACCPKGAELIVDVRAALPPGLGEGSISPLFRDHPQSVHYLQLGEETVDASFWEGDRRSKTNPHEFGHLVGNKDEYHNIDGVEYGAGNANIMGKRGFTNVEFRHFSHVLNTLRTQAGDWFNEDSCVRNVADNCP